MVHLKLAQMRLRLSGYFAVCRITSPWLTRDQELLTRHKALVAVYLEKNFDLFFNRYNSILVQSGSYVTKRQSIKLLGEILLDRANYAIMTQYVESGEHLKICMTLLKDDRKMVQYEGFHVFKVCLLGPNALSPSNSDGPRYSLQTPISRRLYREYWSTIERDCFDFCQRSWRTALRMSSSRMKRVFLSVKSKAWDQHPHDMDFAEICMFRSFHNQLTPSMRRKAFSLGL